MTSKRHVALLISLDTLRADRLGCYGATPSPSPNLDDLARRSLVFDGSAAASNNTLSTHSAMFTGLHSGFALQLQGDPERFARHGSLATWLAAGGVETAAFGHGPIARVRAVHDFETLSLRDKGRESIRETIDWLNAHRASTADLFAFLHVYDIHDPYFESLALVAPENDEILTRDQQLAFNEAMSHRGIEARLGAYDDGIEYVDHLLGPLLDLVERLSREMDVLVVVTADHGEAMGEHDHFFGHTRKLYREVVEVPLVLFGSDLAQPRRLDALTSTVDIAPTLLDFFGQPLPDSLEGRSLMPAVRGETLSPRRFVVAEGRTADERMIQTKTTKLIVTRHGESETRQLFDRLHDHREARDLSALDPAEAGRLARALESYFGLEARRLELLDEPGAETSEALERDLRALGYVN